MEEDNKKNVEESVGSGSALTGTREPSMTSLLVWNISKAQENNPSIDLKTAIKDVQDRLNEDSRNFNSIISLHPEDRYLACALLAWQELGHDTADSLYEFVEGRIRKYENNKQSCILKENLLDRTKRDPTCFTDKKCMEIVDKPECLYNSSKKEICCYNKTAIVQVVANIKNSVSSNLKIGGNSQHTIDNGEDLKDNSDKVTQNNAKEAECKYDYIMTPKNQVVVDHKDSISSYYKTEGNSQYVYDKGKDMKDSTYNIIHTNVKKPICRYDYIMTPKNQIVSSVKDSTSSQYKSEENLQYTYNRSNDINESSDKIIHTNVRKPICRYDYIMTPRNQILCDVKDSTSSQYKTEENSHFKYNESNNLKDNSDKTSLNNAKKAECRYDYIMTPRNRVDTDIKDTTSSHYKTKRNLQYHEKDKKFKDSCDDAKKPTCRYDYIMTTKYKKVSNINDTNSDDFGTSSLKGPVVKLPTETNIIMRSENVQNVCRHKRKSKCEDPNTKNLNKKIMSKIDAACCIESVCIEQLIELDKTIIELRARASQLARREAERLELLERAEAAWKDLESGYRRRLRLAQEKEEDMAKQTYELIKDRNSYKEACMKLTSLLKETGETAEKDRDKLLALEKEICDCTSVRLRLSQEFASGDAALAELHIKAAQLDRDFQFKEDQARRNSSSIETEADAALVLAHELERALRSELSSLKEQIKLQSEQLLDEDSENCKIKAELQDLQQEKSDMIEDMEGCQGMCDGHIKGKLDELKKKREQLTQLKAKVIECKCKLPVDEAVEVKRTPSLATLCKCMPEDNILDQCSCTSLRSQLLTNLLADLFSGLQTELGGSASIMPCQLLKCLEDKHNWDRSSVVKTNLRGFFSQLLLGELDIAIATSIEKYHATWVGAICAEAKKAMDECENYNEQQRTIERKAQKLASELAEQLYNERADQLIQRAKDIVSSGPLPCDCNQQTAAVYPCLVKQPTIRGRTLTKTSAPHSHWQRFSHEVTQMKAQIDDFKKDTIKKEDYVIMDNKITKLSLVPETTSIAMTNLEKRDNTAEGSNRKGNKYHRCLKIESTKQPLNQNLSSIKRKLNITSKKKTNNALNVNTHVDKSCKLYKKLDRTYAVNVCLCGEQNEPQKLANKEKDSSLLDHQNKTSWKEQKSSGVILDMSGNVKQTKPISVQMPSISAINARQNKASTDISCISNYPCFHKVPSNSSINKLLDYLAKWRHGLKKNDNEQNVPNLTNKINPNRSFKNKTGFDSTNSGTPYPSKGPEIEKALPITESEYIGAINLDKSNDCFCNSTKEMIVNFNTVNKEPMQDSQLRFQCSDAKCIRSLENKEGKLNGNRFSKHHSILSNNDQSINQTQKLEKSSQHLQLKKNKSSPLHNREDNNIGKSKQKTNDSKENALESGIYHIINNPEIPNDRDCCIKFLGVTLTNNISPAVLDENIGDYHMTNNFEHVKVPITQNNINCEYKNDINNVPTVSNPDRIACQYEIQFNELKKIIGTTFGRHEEFYKKNNDEPHDLHSIKNSLVDIPENCVCCNTVLLLDETKDLEINTFNLLKDHLKERLEKFKSCYCKSCISSVEEEKMFSSLLQKVKQVISDSANKISYTCPGEENRECSWNRAQSLLQEYLKMKIKRVQGICVETEEKKHEFILPNVSDKVYNLIEDDFQRLKTICKCHCINKQAILNECGEKHVPEKDNNKSIHDSQYLSKNVVSNPETIQNETSNIDAVCKISSNTSMILTQDTSAQVLHNLDMETKSCEAMEKGTKNIQATELIKSYSNKCCNYNEPDHNCGCSLNVQTDKILYNRCTNEVILNDVMKNLQASQRLCYPVLHEVKCDSLPKMQQNVCIHNNVTIPTSQEIPASEKDDADVINSQFTLPYIGYTMECSCNGNQCVDTCIKSTIIQNNKQINNILKNTKDKMLSHNILYIMDSVPKVSTTKCNTNDKCLINDTNNANNTPVKNVRDSKVSVHNEEEIFLKNSNTNLMNISYNTTNTSDSMINFNNNSVLLVKNVSEYMPRKLKHINKQDNCKYHCNILKENSVKSEPFLNSTTKFSEVNKLPCDCSMVPVCHVKMLVQNIENKLIHLKCTCDSLTPKVCPVHSK